MHYIFLLFIFFLFSCDTSLKGNTSQKSDSLGATSDKNSLPHLYNKDGIEIRLDSINGKFVIHVRRDTFEQTTRLQAYDIARSSPHVVWTSDAYACLLTYYSGQYGEYAFLPLKEGLSLRIVKGGMIETDSVQNLILYADTAVQNHYTLVIENLLTQKRKTLQLTSYNHDGFKPILDTITLGKQEAVIIDGNKKYRVDLKEINGT